MNKGNTYNRGQQALITCNNILYEGGGTLDRVLYPVGSIYMSVNSTNPGELFGGKWEQITGRFLYCTTTSKTLGGSTTTGSTTLTTDQIPSHSHYIYAMTGANQWAVGYLWSRAAGPEGGNSEGGQSGSIYTRNTGGGKGHTHAQNLPPYFTVYCWYRVS